jgi:hypothetical protein
MDIFSWMTRAWRWTLSTVRQVSTPRGSQACMPLMKTTPACSWNACAAFPIAARFVCVVALAQSGRLLHTFRGEVEGRVTDAPLGTNGFGYDPIFFYEPFGCTFGQAPLDRKMEVSHRSQALQAMREYLNYLHTG